MGGGGGGVCCVGDILSLPSLSPLGGGGAVVRLLGAVTGIFGVVFYYLNWSGPWGWEWGVGLGAGAPTLPHPHHGPGIPP